MEFDEPRTDPQANATVKRLHAIAHDPNLSAAHLRAVVESIADSVRCTDYGELTIPENDLAFRLSAIVVSLKLPASVH